MALIVLTSASGSPGVTTTALALALTWRRPALLVEADPTGGSAVLAGYFRGRAAPTDSLIDLAFAHRGGTLVESIPSVTMRIPDSTATLIPGTRAHGQARSLTSLWEPLAEAFKSLDTLGQDVIVDAGPAGPGWLTGAAGVRRGPGPAGHPHRPGRAGRRPVLGRDVARRVRAAGHPHRLRAPHRRRRSPVPRPRARQGPAGAGPRVAGLGRANGGGLLPWPRRPPQARPVPRCCGPCARRRTRSPPAIATNREPLAAHHDGRTR